MRQSPLFPILYNAFFNATNYSHSSIINNSVRTGPSDAAAAATAHELETGAPAVSEGIATHPSQAILSSLSPPTIPTRIPASAISPDQWIALNVSVNGRLHADGAPFAAPCFDAQSGGSTTQCASIQSGYLSEKYRVSHVGSFMNPQWETCQATGESCLLNWQNPADPAAFSSPRTCKQGAVSKYYVDVHEPEDVTVAFEFARNTGVRIVIKNTGHDYQGRSSAPDSLTLSTRNVQGISYDPSFQPDNCPGILPQPAMTIGAGTVFGQAYDFAEAHNITFVGGTDRTVAAAGGWVQGGGHSLLSNAFGLGVDRVLQFRVVVPSSGEYLTANACENPDLFYALRGGGGGTFGVVMEASFRVEKQMRMSAAKITFTPSADNWKKVIEIGIQNAVKWSEETWSGVIGMGLVTFVNTRLPLDEAAQSFKPYADFAASVNGTYVIEDSSSWLSFYDKLVGTNPVGLPGAPASRLIPKSHFTTPEKQSALQNAILEGTIPAHFKQVLVSCPSSYSPPMVPAMHDGAGAGAVSGSQDHDRFGTSVTEAWRDCLWSVVAGTFWNYQTDPQGIKAAYEASTEAMRRVVELTPESGTYAAEANVYEKDHERAFWGSNYPRLLSIKQKYDPLGLLDCWHCVGSKGQSDKRFSCMI